MSAGQTPARQRPLSLELQQVIEEKNLLNTDARIKGLLLALLITKPKSFHIITLFSFQ